MSFRTWLYEKATDIVNTVTNPLSVSAFLDKGVLTPEEFVAAGDLLVLKCPSWSWQSVKDPSKLQKGLPKEKQFLLTKNVPSMMRLSDIHNMSNESRTTQVETDDGEGGWLAMSGNGEDNQNEDIPEVSLNDEENSDDDLPEVDLAALSIKETTEDDKTILQTNISKSRRSYDITICYDQYHQTPRVWLSGYNENNEPLKPEEVLQDVSQDHANKTVTVAVHPHLGVTQAYIHPCKHAHVMKKMIDRLVEAGKTPRVDQYLFIFLKFLHAAIPTIEYDYTIETQF